MPAGKGSLTKGSLTIETKSYRVKFLGGDQTHQLAGIVDQPVTSEQTAPGPVVVYSHCFTCNKDLKATVRICRALARSGITVLRFDMTGLGGSEGKYSQTNFTTNLADIAAAVRFADAELGSVTGLIGHSFGGIASLVTAATAGQTDLPLSKLGYTATLAAPSDTQHLADLLHQMNPAIQTQGHGQVTIGGIKWTIDRQMLDDFRSHDVTRLLPGIRCPVLILHSPVDETVSIDHAIRLMTIIQPVAPVSFVNLPHADHLLANDPDDLEFVSGLLSAWSHRY